MTAQLLIATFEGQAAPQTGLVNVLRQLRHGEVGGVMIRADNVTSANQLASLSKLLASAAPRTPLLLIERTGASSTGSLPKAGFSPIPSPREIGDKGDALEAFSIYQNMAKELAASGVSMNIGPLVDVCREESPGSDDLCFGDGPTHAASFASAFIFAHDEQKVLTAMRFRPTGTSLPSVEMLNLVMNRKEPDALFINLDATGGVVTKTIADAQKALRLTGFGGVIIHKRSDVLTPAQTAEALVATLNSGGDMLLFTPSSDWSLGPVADSLQLASDQDLIDRSRIREAFEFVYRMNWRRRQWELRDSGDSVDATSSIYRRPAP
jgi:beta-glucosidase-like glycosyl hydrolase